MCLQIPGHQQKLPITFTQTNQVMFIRRIHPVTGSNEITDPGNPHHPTGRPQQILTSPARCGTGVICVPTRLLSQGHLPAAGIPAVQAVAGDNDAFFYNLIIFASLYNNG
jgi:hypothetical protein